MSWTQIVITMLALVFSTGAVVLQLVGLPGTWLIVLAAVVVKVIEIFVPLGPTELLGWWTLVILLALAGVGELVEVGAGAAGTKVGGGTKRGMIGAVVGSLLGALIATFMIPIPLIGSLIGAVGGAAVGAIVGELSAGGVTLR